MRPGSQPISQATTATVATRSEGGTGPASGSSPSLGWRCGRAGRRPRRGRGRSPGRSAALSRRYLQGKSSPVAWVDWRPVNAAAPTPAPAMTGPSPAGRPQGPGGDVGRRRFVGRDGAARRAGLRRRRLDAALLARRSARGRLRRLLQPGRRLRRPAHRRPARGALLPRRCAGGLRAGGRGPVRARLRSAARRRTRACGATARSSSGHSWSARASWAATFLATGHFVRRVDGERGVELHRGVDDDKDQTYFLWALPRCGAALPAVPARRPDEGRGAGAGGRARPLGRLEALVERAVLRGRHGARPPRRAARRASGPGGRRVRRAAPSSASTAASAFYTIGQKRGLGLWKSHLPRWVIELDADATPSSVGPR